MSIQILIGDSLEILRMLPRRSVNCCVTSPPYYGLRSYLPDGVRLKSSLSADQKASIIAELNASGIYPIDQTTYKKSGIPAHLLEFFEPAEIGLEETPEKYIAAMVAVFREVRRVLRDDGTLFLNLGDSYSVGVPNIPDLIQCDLEGGIFFYGGADPRRGSTQRINVLVYDKRTPNLVFKPLFSAKRVSIKQGDQDLCEIGGFFDAPVECFGSCPLAWGCPSDADTKLLVDAPEHIGIIVAAGNLRTDAALRKSVALSMKDSKASLAIEITAEPVAESIASSVPTFDAISFGASAECIAQIDAVNNPVSLLNGADLASSDRCNFTVRHASGEKLALTLHGGADVCFVGVGHLFLFDVGLCPYSIILEKARRKWNSQKPKQELGIPEMVKRALMEDGWICRQTIIWNKPNPMPESVRDRCTKAHEYIFLLSKSERYFYDNDAVKEPVAVSTIERLSQPNLSEQVGSDRVPFKKNGNMKAVGNSETRNRRSVWTVTTKPYKGAHFATFPPELPELCIKAGCPAGGTVLDPFFGAGTTGLVADRMNRDCIGIELNPAYAEIARKRIQSESTLFADVQVAT